ncbi:MAG: SDR family oxidoreductase [Methylotetracoccus sp.]
MERGHEGHGIRYRLLPRRLALACKQIPRFPMRISDDLRRIRESDLKGFDAVVHLAELSNDPLSQNNPETAFKINHAGSVALAENAKGPVSSVSFTSSCSVGIGKSDVLDETGELNPQTAYAQCKAMVERDVSALAGASFSPVFLRNATAYGASPRMRFDIVLNNLAGLAWTTKKIAMTSDGTPWRPLVHIRDICTAIICAIEAPAAAVHKEVFNVGHDGDNYRVREIAEIVADSFPGCELSFGKPSPDNRSYRVSFEKIHRQLPNFKCEWDARRGAQQLREVFERIAMSRETFEFRAFTRLSQLEYLIRTAQIDSEFFWTH